MTTLMVQTNRLLDNFKRIKKAAGSDIIPVLSGNGSGFGDTAIASILKDYVGMIAVSRIEEAIRIKTNDRMLEVLLLTPYSTEEEVRNIIEYDITATVASNDSAVLLSGIAEQAGKQAKAHLKFDIGAGFFGFTSPEAAKAAQTCLLYTWECILKLRRNLAKSLLKFSMKAFLVFYRFLTGKG